MPLEALTQYAGLLGIPIYLLVIILIWSLIWSLVWKGFALWKSSHKESKIWFIVLLIVNTMGILEILYLFIFSKMGKKKSSKRKKRR